MEALNKRILQSLTQDNSQTMQLIDEYVTFCQDTQDFQAGYDLVLDIQNLGFIETAIHLVDKLYKLCPDEAFVLLKAELLIDHNELDEAIDLLTTLDENSEYYLSSLLVLSDAYQQLELNEVALAKLKLAKQLAPDEDVIDLALYEQYFHMGENQNALDCLTRLENSDILEESVYTKKMARVLGAIGEYEEVIFSLEQLDISEHDSESLFELGLAYYQTEEKSRAYATFKDLLAKDPDFYSAYYYLGKSAIDNGLVEEGVDALKQALNNNPYHETIYLALLEMYQKTHNHQEIISLIDQAKTYQIDGLSWIIEVTRYYAHQEDYETVVDIVSKHLAIEDEESELYWLLARAYAALEDDTNAKLWYKKAYLIFSEDGEFLQEYALYCREIGDRVLYQELMKKAITLDDTLSIEFEEEF